MPLHRSLGLSFAQKQCFGLAGKLARQTDMLHPGCRIGVAVSGGVDSFVLATVLALRRRVVPFPYEVFILHVNPGFDPENHRPLADWCAKMGLASHLEVTDHGPRAHSDENRKRSACFYCARLRRNRLFELCKQYKLTHLAFGHQVDDLAATFFMNLFDNGRVEGLSAKESFFRGELTVIRPLLLVEKKYVRAAAKRWELPIWSNPCPSAGHTNRARTEEWLAERMADKRIRANVFGALTRNELTRLGALQRPPRGREEAGEPLPQAALREPE